MKKIAWIGTGVMGNSMVSHLIDAGYPVSIYTRSKEKAENLKEKAEVYDSIAEAVKDADVVISMVGYPKDVESVYASTEGVFNNVKKGTLCIDMTTSSPTLAEKLYVLAQSNGLRMLDAPVSGGDIGAKNATLSIMVGGDQSDFEEAGELFALMGKTITYIGKAGSGQHCKMANQIVVAGNIAAISESMYYAKNAGVDPNIVLKAVAGGSAGSWQVSNNGPKILSGNYDPGFYIHHFIKDLTLVEEEAGKTGISLPVVHQVLALYRQLLDEGYGQLGTQALIMAYKKNETDH
ncbi:MAG: oxidoreductase [Firmicutes bacterium HGW-Firmicutes-10]|jgi:3-hydroxyisobutyrate dehydrogenase-like beta-hydroxyacid dehydrogenase|nr:MAG: oxidoreductase [Firmicutes bacterium HGW-Firmicutes-10]